MRIKKKLCVLATFLISFASGLSLCFMLYMLQANYVQTHLDMYCREKSVLLSFTVEHIMQEAVPYAVGLTYSRVIDNPSTWVEIQRKAQQYQGALNPTDVFIIEKVLHENRDGYEKRLSKMYKRHMTIVELLNGSLRTSLNKTVYYVSTMFISRTDETKLIGFDFLSDFEFAARLGRMNQSAFVFAYNSEFEHNGDVSVFNVVTSGDIMPGHSDVTRIVLMTISMKEILNFMIDPVESIELHLVPENTCLTSSSDSNTLRAMNPVRVLTNTLQLCCTADRNVLVAGWGRYAFIVVVILFLAISLLTPYMVWCLFRAQDLLFRARKSEKELRDFMAFMCHEFRNPLHQISGLLSLCEENLAGEIDQQSIEQLNNNLALVKCSSMALSVLINDFLDLSKLRAGKFTINVVDTDFAKLIERLDLMYAAICKEHGLDWICVSHEAAARVELDPIRFCQVAFNLLDNSLKFTHDGFIKLDVKTENGFIVLVVSDSGEGIDQDKLSVLFEEYSNTQFSSKFIGSGLGLPIVKHLVDLMHGAIDVTSAKGRGTTFLVKIPTSRVSPMMLQRRINPQPAIMSFPPDFTGQERHYMRHSRLLSLTSNINANNDPPRRPACVVEQPVVSAPAEHTLEVQPIPATSSETAALLGINILAAEDIMINRRLLKKYLESIPCVDSFVIVENGLLACNAFRAEPKRFHLVLLDIMMPVMDGMEAFSKIKEMDPSAVIYAMTANGSPDDNLRLTKHGFKGNLSKPFNAQGIQGLITEHLARFTFNADANDVIH